VAVLLAAGHGYTRSADTRGRRIKRGQRIHEVLFGSDGWAVIVQRHLDLCDEAGIGKTLKHHLHLRHRSLRMGNPRHYATFLDESMNHSCAQIADRSTPLVCRFKESGPLPMRLPWMVYYTLLLGVGHKYVLKVMWLFVELDG